jgi:ESF2/ABP1 family protein
VDSDDGRWDQQFSEESDAEQSVHSHSDVDHPSEADHHPSKADEQPAVQTPKSRKRTVSKLLSKEELSESRAAMEKTGVVYLSRIPPGMSPTKIRQLLSAYKSRVLRIFLSPESMAVYTRRLKSGGSKKRQFTEGWVEFEDKKVAKKVAEMLNAQQIGGKKGSRWYDDLWNIKYLPKFKWHHLTEQIGIIFLVCATNL